MVAPGEQQRDGSALIIVDERSAVAPEAERLVGARSFDLDLIVKPEVSEIVADDDVVYFERRHDAGGQTGGTPDFVNASVVRRRQIGRTAAGWESGTFRRGLAAVALQTPTRPTAAACSAGTPCLQLALGDPNWSPDSFSGVAHNRPQHRLVCPPWRQNAPHHRERQSDSE